MKHLKTISVLVVIILLLGLLATLAGIWSSQRSGQYTYTSIRGKSVLIYGKGLYKHMSAEVAPQGIAQDYVTLFVGIPLLIISLLLAKNGSWKGRYLLSGTLGYFLVTYLFYTVMAMYNVLFLVYVCLLGTSFYAFILSLRSLDAGSLPGIFKASAAFNWIGAFLIFSACSIALLWLSIILPPLMDGSVIPVQAEHYTSLVVQGLDLGILLPAAVICGISLILRKTQGYLFAPVYLVFLSLLMIALTAKVMTMDNLGYEVIPVIFIIPAFNLITVICTVSLLKKIGSSSI